MEAGERVQRNKKKINTKTLVYNSNYNDYMKHFFVLFFHFSEAIFVVDVVVVVIC